MGVANLAPRADALAAVPVAVATSPGAHAESRRLKGHGTATVLRLAAAVAVGGLVVYLLLPQLVTAAQNWPMLTSPGWGWVAALVVAAVATHVMGAVVLTSSTVQPLHFPTTVSVQFASSFTNRLAPSGLGAMATTVRYLRRRGASRPGAAVAVGLGSSAGFVIHTLATTVVLAAVAPHLFARWRPPSYWPWIAAGVPAAVVLAALCARRFWFDPSRDALRAGAEALRGVMSSPRRGLGLFAGSAGVTLAYALGLAASLHAYDVRISMLDILAVFLGASAISAGSPTPGGMGAAEAALIAAATTLVGQSVRVVDAVLLFRLVTFWMPSLGGGAALIHLRRNAVL